MSAPTPAPGIDAFALVRARWRVLAVAMAVAGVAALAYGLLAPKWYRAQLVVVPVPPPKASVPMLGAGAGGVASSLDLPVELSLGPSDVERVSAVLKSGSVTDAVIEKFDLTRRYRKKYIEDTRKKVWKHCATKAERKPATVTLSCEDKDPAVAKAMADYFGEIGNKVFRRISHSAAGEERAFLERRVSDARRDMDEASRKMREFQEKNKVVDLGEQSKAVVAAMATLRAEMLAKQIQLSYLDGFSSRDEATAEQLHRQISILQSKLLSMEESRLTAAPGEAGRATTPSSRPAERKAAKARAAKDKESGGGIFPPALSVPKLRHELEHLYREQKLQETLFVMLTQRYETARVSEARDTSTFQILDHPTLPTKRDRPKRMLILALGLAFGLAFGLAWILGPSWWRSLPAAPGPKGNPLDSGGRGA